VTGCIQSKGLTKLIVTLLPAALATLSKEESSNVHLILIFESDDCRGEQLRSLRRHKCMISVLVHDTAPRPVYLEARPYRDFAVSALYNQRLEELIQDIEMRSSATLASNYQHKY